ncbi:sigma-70 family RNA polymerase sigma factor [Runella rosea]|uniref:Sigma-70 family RNA polymerase sigma factor n=1 Tax=Runella rosea TaxID=2259595 RepID=A0A344TP96_9BACT|nr:sigma-70 family RNA polymerase sigma factor [Runella rosea]AXE20467.1 sigma-70 family RNA polymerase sigma factor [Runella rosea]
MVKLPDNQSTFSDLQLWIQLKNGSELALGKLIKKYFNPLQNYGYKFIRDEDFVKDCVQEVFIEVWQRRDRLSTPDSVRAYLLSSVRKRVLREGFRQQIIKEDEPIDLENNWHFVELPHERLMIEEEHEAQLKHKIGALLNQLPKRQREAIYLQFYQDLEREEIAQIMDIHPQSVSNLLQTAFKLFRQNWQVIYALLGIFDLFIF